MVKKVYAAGILFFCGLASTFAQETATEKKQPVKLSTSTTTKEVSSVVSSRELGDVVFKTKDGRILVKEQVDSMQKTGPLQMSTVTVNGKTKMIVSNVSREEVEARANERGNFISKWTGKPAPDVSFTGLDGKTYSLADLKGKTVIMNFWFIGCKPCVQEMPQLNTIVEKYKKNKDVVFLAPALDKAEQLQSFLKRRSFDYTILADAGKATRDGFGISTFPTHLVINKAGVIEQVLIGSSLTLEQDLEKYINAALAKK